MIIIKKQFPVEEITDESFRKCLNNHTNTYSVTNSNVHYNYI